MIKVDNWKSKNESWQTIDKKNKKRYTEVVFRDTKIEIDKNVLE